MVKSAPSLSEDYFDIMTLYLDVELLRMTGFEDADLRGMAQTAGALGRVGIGVIEGAGRVQRRVREVRESMTEKLEQTEILEKRLSKRMDRISVLAEQLRSLDPQSEGTRPIYEHIAQYLGLSTDLVALVHEAVGSKERRGTKPEGERDMHFTHMCRTAEIARAYGGERYTVALALVHDVKEEAPEKWPLISRSLAGLYRSYEGFSLTDGVHALTEFAPSPEVYTAAFERSVSNSWAMQAEANQFELSPGTIRYIAKYGHAFNSINATPADLRKHLWFVYMADRLDALIDFDSAGMTQQNSLARYEASTRAIPQKDLTMKGLAPLVDHVRRRIQWEATSGSLGRVRERIRTEQATLRAALDAHPEQAADILMGRRPIPSPKQRKHGSTTSPTGYRAKAALFLYGADQPVEVAGGSESTALEDPSNQERIYQFFVRILKENNIPLIAPQTWEQLTSTAERLGEHEAAQAFEKMAQVQQEYYTKIIPFFLIDAIGNAFSIFSTIQYSEGVAPFVILVVNYIKSIAFQSKLQASEAAYLGQLDHAVARIKELLHNHPELYHLSGTDALHEIVPRSSQQAIDALAAKLRGVSFAGAGIAGTVTSEGVSMPALQVLGFITFALSHLIAESPTLDARQEEAAATIPGMQETRGLAARLGSLSRVLHYAGLSAEVIALLVDTNLAALGSIIAEEEINPPQDDAELADARLMAMVIEKFARLSLHAVRQRDLPSHQLIHERLPSGALTIAAQECPIINDYGQTEAVIPIVGHTLSPGVYMLVNQEPPELSEATAGNILELRARRRALELQTAREQRAYIHALLAMPDIRVKLVNTHVVPKARSKMMGDAYTAAEGAKYHEEIRHNIEQLVSGRQAHAVEVDAVLELWGEIRGETPDPSNFEAALAARRRTLEYGVQAQGRISHIELERIAVLQEAYEMCMEAHATAATTRDGQRVVSIKTMILDWLEHHDILILDDLGDLVIGGSDLAEIMDQARNSGKVVILSGQLGRLSRSRTARGSTASLIGQRRVRNQISSYLVIDAADKDAAHPAPRNLRLQASMPTFVQRAIARAE